jgi:hypothetical protein
VIAYGSFIEVMEKMITVDQSAGGVQMERVCRHRLFRMETAAEGEILLHGFRIQVVIKSTMVACT